MTEPKILQLTSVMEGRGDRATVFGLGDDGKLYRWQLAKHDMISGGSYYGPRKDARGKPIVVEPAGWVPHE